MKWGRETHTVNAAIVGRGLAVGCLLFAATCIVDAREPSGLAELTTAQTMLRDGDSVGAARFLSAYILQPQSTASKLAAIWMLSDLQRAQGSNRAALDVLALADATESSVQERSMTDIRRVAALHGLGAFDDAEAVLGRINADSDQLDLSSRAALAVLMGNLAVERRDAIGAQRAFTDAQAFAQQADLPGLEARARLNGVRAQLDDLDLRDLEARLRAIGPVIDREQNQAERAMLYVSLGDLAQRSVREFDRPPEWRLLAESSYTRALEESTDDLTRANAYGFLGSLREDQARLHDASRLTRQALFHAQAVGANEQIYRWEWQLGRLLRSSGERDGAIDAYARATFYLNDVKPNLALGSRSTFNKRVAPVYTEYADLLLERSASRPEGEQKQFALRSVRDLLETLKRAEIEDYFARECIVRGKAHGLATYDRSAAIIYPVVLENRLELLVETDGHLAQFTQSVTRNELTRMVRRFRLNLERPHAGDAYLANSRALYRWLVAPLESYLRDRNIRTLVFVPEGPLRTIPPAALHDGRMFLVERYAIAMQPGMDLTEAAGTSASGGLLVGGISDAVQGYAELPRVNDEVQAVAAMYPGRALKNEAFQLDALGLDLPSSSFSMAHFATHGEFSSDRRKSFLLTYDDRLTMTGLRDLLERRDEDSPLDLLVLSACRTAAGDDRAALGLAGVAVQSGARTALASLWYISDSAAAEIVAHFYEALRTPGVGKAESLRRAQLALIEMDAYRHPSYWAPYLLIGNWL